MCLAYKIQRRDTNHRRMRLVDDHGPRTVRMSVRGYAWRTVDRSHLCPWVGGHSRRIECGVFDRVTHAPHVVRTHRLHVHQRAAVVEVELAMPPVVNGVPKIHELRRSSDIRLQPFEERDDVVAFEVQRLLHPPGTDRTRGRPLL